MSEFTYDEVPYPSYIFPQTSPDRLATMATLFGMHPVPPNACRLLEIGCGDGTNLLAHAFALAESDFVGIDLSQVHIAAAVESAGQLEMKNVRFEQADILDFDFDRFGTFDYIIAHGVYSWVPPNVQERILGICRDHLSPRGVAFISFNTGPAGRIRQLTRDMMKFHLHAAGIEGDPVREGREFLQMLVGLADEGSMWKAVLETEAGRLSKRADSVTFHDELGPGYSSVYFSDFVAAAERNGLQFLSDVNLSDAIEPLTKPEAAQALERLARGDVVKYQQYLDFLVFRGFRRTLLCHREIQLERGHLLERAQTLMVASPLTKSSVAADGGVVFTKRHGSARITTNDPIVSLALERLETDWPRALRFSELAGAIVAKIPSNLQQDAPKVLAQALLKLAANKLVDLRTHQAPLAESVGERPMATSLARLQAEENTSITTLLHTQIEFSNAETRALLRRIDGTRNLQDLVSAMRADVETSRDATEENVMAALAVFRSVGLLVSESHPEQL